MSAPIGRPGLRSPSRQADIFPRAAPGNPQGPAPVLRRPGFGVAGSPWLGLAGGLAWGLTLMRRDRWRGIVGYTAESSASPRRRGPGGARSKGATNDQVTDPAESTEPPPDAAAGAGRCPR